MAAVCCEMNAVPVCSKLFCSDSSEPRLVFFFGSKKGKRTNCPIFLLELQQLNISTESRVNAFPSFIIWCQIFKNVSYPKIIIMGNKEIVKYFDLEKII